MRQVKFQTGEYYHIYNRGVDKRDIFMDDKDFVRFLRSIREFNSTQSDGGFYIKYLKEKRDSQRGSTSKLEVEPRPGSEKVEPRPEDGLEQRGSTSKLEVEPRPEDGLEQRGSTSKLEVEPRSGDKLVDIICYTLIPNHFHFTLRQLSDDGITKFMQKIGTAYTMYFNKKYNRSGSLFQGRFKAIHAKEYSHLLKLLVYVNCNCEIHNFGKAGKWIWSSYLDSIGERDGTLCNLGIIKENFKTSGEFKEFCDEVIPEIKENKKLQKYLLE